MARTGRVLVVDDEVNARTARAELLRDEGYEVEIAADAFKALGKYEAFSPHVVITDLEMPGMDGIELIKQLRAEEEAAAAALVVMTAFGDVASAVEAMRAGAAEYLTKPLDFDELLVVLGKVLEHQALRRETRQLRQRVRARVAPNHIVGDSPPAEPPGSGNDPDRTRPWTQATTRALATTGSPERRVAPGEVGPRRFGDGDTRSAGLGRPEPPWAALSRAAGVVLAPDMSDGCHATAPAHGRTSHPRARRA